MTTLTSTAGPLTAGALPGPLGRLRSHWWPLAPAVAPVLLLAVPVSYGNGSSTSTHVSAADAASVVLVLFCAVRLLRRRARPLTPAAAAVLGMPAVGIAVATMTAGDPSAALPGLVRYLQIFVLVPAAVVLLLRDARDYRVVAGSFVVLAVLQGGSASTSTSPGPGPPTRARTSGRWAPSGPPTSWAWRRWSPAGW